MTDDEFQLCQPRAHRPGPRGSGRPVGVPSCAACCGIYNYHGHHRALVTEVLERQTRLLQSWDGTEPDLERIREAAEQSRPPVRFEVLYNCPFTGFLDEQRTRVGCLLHPRVRARDLREFCRYGHRTCAEARCTAYTYLEEDEAEAVMAAAGDWYRYGLCITDIDLVKDFFELVESKLVGPVDRARVAREPELAAAFGDYLALKENWPWATDPGRFGKYYFEGRNYYPYMIDCARMGRKRPSHHDVITALGSVIETGEELDQAVALVDERVEAFARVYTAGARTGKDRAAVAREDYSPPAG